MHRFQIIIIIIIIVVGFNEKRDKYQFLSILTYHTFSRLLEQLLESEKCERGAELQGFLRVLTDFSIQSGLV